MKQLSEELLDKIMLVKTSPKLMAVIGYVFDLTLTEPNIIHVYVIPKSDLVMVSTSDKPMHAIFSNYHTLEENWNGFFHTIADLLTEEEKEYINQTFQSKVKRTK